MLENLVENINHPYATHIVRTLLEILSGIRIYDGTQKHLNRTIPTSYITGLQTTKTFEAFMSYIVKEIMAKL